MVEGDGHKHSLDWHPLWMSLPGRGEEKQEWIIFPKSGEGHPSSDVTSDSPKITL